jgi:hypothetical protein
VTEIIIPLFVGQINIKRVENTLFSERYGHVPTFSIFGWRVTWRKWRKI